MDSTQKYLKWGFLGVFVLGVAYFALPILAKMALDAFTIAIVGVGLAGLYIFLPALAEWASQASYKLWTLAISTDPINRLRRDLAQHAKDIQALEGSIAQVVAARIKQVQLLNENRKNFDAMEIQAYQEDIDEIAAAEKDLKDARDEMLLDLDNFQILLQKMIAHDKMGKGFKIAADALSAAGKLGIKSDGSKIAIDTIQNRLNESRSRLAVLRSRKPLDEIRQRRREAGIIDVTPAPTALPNNPSPTLQAVSVKTAAPVVHDSMDKFKSL